VPFVFLANTNKLRLRGVSEVVEILLFAPPNLAMYADELLLLVAISPVDEDV
jgi:hypothetical protein